MYSRNDLVNEIRAISDGFLKKGIAMHPDWVTDEIMKSHKDIKGDDADFYLLAARDTVRDEVRKQINRFKLSPEKALDIDRQLILDGFERLQIAYVIDISGTAVAISLKKMTSDQRRAKSSELRAMGAGCYQHADELDRYDDLSPNDLAA